MLFSLLSRNAGLKLLAVAVACSVAIGNMQIPQLQKLSTKPEKLTPEQVKRDIEAETLYLRLARRTPSLGFRNVIANWTFLKFLQYFGDDDARNISDYRLSPEYFEVILGLDPRFLQAYLFLSGSTSIYAGMPERTIEIMDNALKSVTPYNPPRSYLIWRYRAIDELLFLGDAEVARRSFEKSADWASVYTDEESQFNGALSRRTAQFLARNPDSKLAQFSAWSMILFQAVDEKTRQRAVIEITALGGKVTRTPQGRFQVTPPTKD